MRAHVLTTLARGNQEQIWELEVAHSGLEKTLLFGCTQAGCDIGPTLEQGDVSSIP